MSTAALAALTADVDAERTAAEQAYRAVVEALAEDKHVEPGEALSACELTLRTMADLSRDVERLVSRRRAVAILADQDAIERDRFAANQQLEAAFAFQARVAAEAKERVTLARHAVKEVAERARVCGEARRLLAQTASPELIATANRLREEIHLGGVQVRKLEDAIRIAKQDASQEIPPRGKIALEDLNELPRDKEKRAKIEQEVAAAKAKLDGKLQPALDQAQARLRDLEQQLAEAQAAMLQP